MRDKVSEQEDIINQLALKLPKVLTKDTFKSYQNCLNELYFLTEGTIKKQILFMCRGATFPKHLVEDMIAESYIWSVQIIESFVTAKRHHYVNYLKRSIKNKVIRFVKHNKYSYFTRNKNERVCSFSEEAFSFNMPSSLVYYHKPDLKIHTFTIQFRNFDRNVIDKCKNFFHMVAVGATRKFIQKKIDDQFVLDWCYYQLTVEYQKLRERGFDDNEGSI